MLPYALARVRSKRSTTIATLANLLEEREMVLQSLDVLGRLKAVEVIDKIIPLTSHPDQYVRKEAEKALARIRKDPKRFQHLRAMRGDPGPDASAEYSFNLGTYHLGRLLAQLSEAGVLPIDAKTAKDFELFAALMELEQVESFKIDPNPEAPIYLLLRCCDESELDVDFWSTSEKIAELTKIIEPILEDIEEEDSK
jgi:HEAT repeat protein